MKTTPKFSAYRTPKIKFWETLTLALLSA